jgi:hypothetical protein
MLDRLVSYMCGRLEFNIADQYTTPHGRYDTRCWCEALEVSSVVQILNLSGQNRDDTVRFKDGILLAWLDAFDRNRKARLTQLRLPFCMGLLEATQYGVANKIYTLVARIIRRHFATLTHVDLQDSYFQFVDEQVLMELVSALIYASPRNLSWSTRCRTHTPYSEDSGSTIALLLGIRTKYLTLSSCCNVVQYVAFNVHLKHLHLEVKCCHAQSRYACSSLLCSALKHNTTLKSLVFLSVFGLNENEIAAQEEVARNVSCDKKRNLLKWEAIKKLRLQF